MRTKNLFNYLLPQEWTLLAITIMCTFLFPTGFLEFCKIYSNSIITLFVVILTFQNYFGGILKIPKDNYSILLFSFGLLNLVSYFWAYNVSLIWARSALWFVLFFFYINIRSIDFDKFNMVFWLRILTIILSINLLLIIYSFWLTSYDQVSGFSFSYNSISKSDSYFKWINGNYISSSLLFWVPIYNFLIHKKIGNRYLNIVILLLIILIILFYNSRASSIALFLIVLFSAIYLYKKNKSLQGFLILGLSFLTLALILVFIMSDSQTFISSYNPLKTIFENSSDDRPEIWKNSIKLFKEHPITGVGSGNWSIEVLRFGRNEYNNYGSYMHAHNLFVQSLSELGILGFLLVIALFIFPIIQAKRKNVLSNYLCFSLIGFLIVNSFYGIPSLSLNLMCIWIFISGILMNESKTKFIKKNTVFITPILLLSFSFLFFKEYADISMNTYSSLNRKERLLPANSRLVKKSYLPGINEFYGMTHLNFYLSNTLPSEQSIRILEEGVAKNPYALRELFELGRKYEELNDFDNALTTYKRILQLHERHFASFLRIGMIGNRNEYWSEFETCASFFEEYVIPHYDEYYDKEEAEKKPDLRKFWKHRLILIRNYKNIKKQRQQIKQKHRNKQKN